MRKLFFVVLILDVPVFCFGQGEYNIWHFGNHAGIDFNSGIPVAVTSPLNTSEGCASICNASGNLLFSTDGMVVYNSFGDTLGAGLFGYNQATQSALIVPFPNNNNKYYIFTADDDAGSHGICYSVVDMTLNSGLGGLISINSQLLSPACEKLTAIRNTNGTDFWVIVHAYPSNEYYVYPVTVLGVGLPLIYPIGSPISQFSNIRGYLKASPDGQKIADVRSNYINDTLELFDFNPSTGVLSNYISFPIPNWAYGVSFSPDNTKLYISFEYIYGINIQQYDLTINNFQNYPYIVIQGAGIFHEALQIGPDGKIYCSTADQNTIAIINNPNLAGSACNYTEFALTLSNGSSPWDGLPNIIENYFTAIPCPVNLGADILKCVNSTPNILDAGIGFNSYLWSNGSTSQSITISSVGNYSVTVTNNFGCYSSDTIIVFQPPSPNYSVITQTDSLDCLANGTGTIDIDATGGTGSYTYQWSNGATTQDLSNLNAGTYTVTVTDSIGCIVSNPPITIVQINDLQVNNTAFNNLKCHDDTNGFINVTVLNGLSPNNYEWSNGATTEDLNNLTAGTYSVTVSDAGGCTASDTVVITAPNQVIASLTIAADTVFCSVTGGTPSYHYHWSTGATTAFIDSATNGTYTVTVSDINNCTAVTSVVISDVPSINEEGDFVIYPNPCSEWLVVSGSWLGDATFEITDILGRKMESNHQLPTTNHYLDVSNYTEGVYFIKLVSSLGVTVVKKFVVVH